jgi:hypothetical protein
MVFKGTRRRSARDIALVLERLGGSLDAYTSREHTSYQARVLDEDLETALDVLADFVVNPLLRDADLALEREVVLEEISMVEDTPTTWSSSSTTQALWPDHPYGHSILGTRESVAAMTADDLRRIHRRAYGRAGPGGGGGGRGGPRRRGGGGGAPVRGVPAPAAALPCPPGPLAPSGGSFRAAGAQTHIVLGRTVAHADPRRFAWCCCRTRWAAG